MLAVTAVLAVTSLAACSGSDSEGSKADDSPSPSLSGPPEGADDSFDRPCQVEVTLSGSVEASWKGEGASTNEAGPTTYTFTQDQDQLIVYAGKGDIVTNANLTVDGATYITKSQEGLDVAGNGTGATVDADTKGTGGAGPHLVASFACGKDAQGKGKS